MEDLNEARQAVVIKSTGWKAVARPNPPHRPANRSRPWLPPTGKSGTAMPDKDERAIDPLALLLLEDRDAAACDQGRAGHPALGVNRLLELLADPDHPGAPVQCPQCRRPLEFETGFYKGQPALREILPDGTALIYMLHPELTASLRHGLQSKDGPY